MLGAVRPGWEITSNEETIGTGPGGFKVVPLTSIEPGHRDNLNSSTLGTEGFERAPVTFTTDDLPKIGAGQVPASIDRKHTKVMSPASFVNERCG